MGDLNERRRAFLVGEGTLTVREAREWARELAHQVPTTWAGFPPLPPGMTDNEPLMVSIADMAPTVNGFVRHVR